MKILFIVPYPTEGPSNRYRIEQYLPYLKEKGIDYSLRPFISSEFFKVLYKKGNFIKKSRYFLNSAARRFYDLVSAAKYDLIFIHIESFPFGPAIFEWSFSKLGKPIIYDFEDAVYLADFKGQNKFKKFLYYPHKFYQILKMSSHIIVCNRFMKDFVYPFNHNVSVIPTSIDTDNFKLKDFNQHNQKPVIGWIGSHTTLYCLRSLTDVFAALAKKYDFILKVVGGGQVLKIPGVNIINEDWTLQKDVENFQSLDIGVYPLPNDERSKAKTPFKTIQYMSVGVPAVVSKVGGNLDIVQDGVNGFLALTDEEWREKLSFLIQNAAARNRIGLLARETVEKKYSLKIYAKHFLEVIQRVLDERGQ